MTEKTVPYVQITPRFFKEMSDEEFHNFLHAQRGCLTLDQYGKVMRMNAEDRAAKKEMP